MIHTSTSNNLGALPFVAPPEGCPTGFRLADSMCLDNSPLPPQAPKTQLSVLLGTLGYLSTEQKIVYGGIVLGGLYLLFGRH